MNTRGRWSSAWFNTAGPPTRVQRMHFQLSTSRCVVLRVRRSGTTLRARGKADAVWIGNVSPGTAGADYFGADWAGSRDNRISTRYAGPRSGLGRSPLRIESTSNPGRPMRVDEPAHPGRAGSVVWSRGCAEGISFAGIVRSSSANAAADVQASAYDAATSESRKVGTPLGSVAIESVLDDHLANALPLNLPGQVEDEAIALPPGHVHEERLRFDVEG